MKYLINFLAVFFIGGLVIAATTTDSDITGIAGGSAGFVTGSTDNAILRADGTGGVTSQSSACTITDGGRMTCTTDGSGTTEFDALTFDTASGGRPRINFGAATVATVRVNSTNMLFMDGLNNYIYASPMIFGLSLTLSSLSLSQQNGGILRYTTTGASNSAFAFTDDTAGNDWDAIVKVTSNKTDTIPVAIVGKASQAVPLQEWRKSDGTVHALVGATGGIKPASVTADPCADTTNFPPGTFFYNSTSGYPCFCNNSNADVKFTDNTTACF